MHRLRPQGRRESLALGLVTAARDHVLGDVTAVDVQPGAQERNEQSARPARDVERRAAAAFHVAPEVRDLERAEVVVELGPVVRDQSVVPGLRLGRQLLAHELLNALVEGKSATR